MYYRRKTRKKISNIKMFTLILIMGCMIAFISLIYYVDRVITPRAILLADSEMRAKVIEIINKNILEIYGNDFNYTEIIDVEKDSGGKITMLKADTVKLNSLAVEVAINSQKQIKEFGEVGVKIPLGFITKNNLLAYWGPSIVVKMQPIGRVELEYDSTFESAGINQTRHKIYVNAKTNLRVVLPTISRDVQIKSEIPIAETIIVGEVPRTALGVDFLRNSER